MYSAIHECVGAANLKLQALLKTLRFHNDRGILQIFKSHLLSFIEYRTVAISHCSPSSLEPVNDILTRLLVRLGITHEEALFHFNLAPLETRRDIAQLGLIHRAVLRQGPPHLHKFFVRVGALNGHNHQAYDPTSGSNLQYIQNSLFGFIGTYNRLPQRIVDLCSVSEFQSELQHIIKKAVV